MSSDAVLTHTLAMAISAVAQGQHDVARELVATAHTALVNRNKQVALPGVEQPAEKVPSDEVRRAGATRIFRYWQERCDHKQAKLTPERSRCVLARLRDGYSEAEIRKAIDGAAVAAYVNEESGQRYDDLTLICRNGSKLESFIERGVKATGEIAAEVAGPSSPVEDQIAQIRRDMATYRRDGRGIEYENAARELQQLMTKRGTR